jgi:hypothetical protein
MFTIFSDVPFCNDVMRMEGGWTDWVILVFCMIAAFRLEVAEYRAFLTSDAASICKKVNSTRCIINQKSAVLFSELNLLIYVLF